MYHSALYFDMCFYSFIHSNWEINWAITIPKDQGILEEERLKDLQDYNDKCFNRVLIGIMTKIPTPSNKHTHLEGSPDSMSSPSSNYEDILASTKKNVKSQCQMSGSPAWRVPSATSCFLGLASNRWPRLQWRMRPWKDLVFSRISEQQE